MTIPVDPGTSLLDNNNEPILLAGATGLHERFAELYAMFNGGIGPDNLMLGATYLWTGAHTFNAGNLKVKGAGAGIASLQNANTATNRTLTIPDPGVDDTLLSTKYVKVAGAGAGIASLQNANTGTSRTITIPDPGADDTLVTQLTMLNPNGISNLGLKAATTTDANDSIKLTSCNATALSSSNKLYATLPDDVTPGQFEVFSFTSDITLKISGAHWGTDTYGNLTNSVLRVGLINDGGATPALAVYYLGGRNSIISNKCFSTATSVTEPEYVLTNRALAVGTWPLQEIGYFLASFDDSTNKWSINTSEIWPGKSGDGIWRHWVPALTGLSAWTIEICRWTQIGKMISILFAQDFALAGTSTSTAFTITNAPVKAGGTYYSSARVRDNSTVSTTPGAVNIDQRLITCYKTWNSATSWTAANDKGVNFTLTYESLY